MYCTYEQVWKPDGKLSKLRHEAHQAEVMSLMYL